MTNRPSHLALILWGLSLLAMRADARPNIVFMYADDQRFDAMSAVQKEQGDRARFPWFATPNMDRIAGEGVRFRNAFVVTALCSPSRAAFLSGRYNHANGIIDNKTPLPATLVTHASLLRSAGYVTGYCGKWHMGPQSGQRPGFDFSASFVGQGKYVDCPIEVNGKSTPSTGWVDDVTTDYAIDFIKQNQAKPFLLCLGFKSPHGPFDPPARLEDKFAGSLARRAVNADVPPPFPRNARPRPGEVAPTEKAAEVPVNLGYFRCIAGVDENIGRVLKVLDELKLADNTLVIYSSDNGYYHGEHGLGDKRSAYDESMRIPFLVRYPPLNGGGRTLDPMILNIDLAPTLLDFAGVGIPKEMQGRSLRPLLEGKDTPWRTEFFYAYFYERPFFTPTLTAVRTETHKLVKYPGHEEWTELFDLKADPHEMKNLARDPAQADLLKRMTETYEKAAQAVDFRIPENADKPGDAPATRGAGGSVLLYDFAKDDKDQVVDASGKGNHGKATDAGLAEGRPGARARKFDGKGHIDVPKSVSLDPSGGAWTVDVTLKSDAKTGVILARGGASQGYALHLDDGKVLFSVNASDQATTVAGKTPIDGKWVTIRAAITAKRQMRLYIDGKLDAECTLPKLIERDPREAMQIGADLGSQVTTYRTPARFTGQIERVELYSGEKP